MPTDSLTREQLEQARRRPKQSIQKLDKADCEEKLIDFAAYHWEYVEPARPFVRGWAIEAICDHLEAVARGEIRFLLMNVPPGFMKSLTTDVFYPAWVWGPRNRPSDRFVCASYSHDLTIRDNVRCRLVIQSPKYQSMWGDRFAMSDAQNSKIKFSNDKTGFKLATSVQGVGTGERGDCVIVDDPHNVFEAESDVKRASVLQWFTEVMPTRVNDAKTAAYIVIMQRVHEADVSGHILEKELGYTHLCIPMHHDPNHPHVQKRREWIGWTGDPRKKENELAFPERYGEAEIAQMAKVMMSWGGTYAVAGQFEQRPEPRGGGMVKKEWFDIVECIPPGAHVRCRGWDFAGTEGGDGAGTASVRTCEVSWTEGGKSGTDLYVEDCTWDQLSPGGVYEFVRATIAADGYQVFQSLPQDPGQAGKYQVSDFLAMFAGYDFEFTLESGDKEIRFRPWAAQCETRNKIHRRIKLVRGDWNARYLDHVSKFPRGRYKDIPDAQSRSYGGLVSRGGGTFMVGGSTLVQGAPRRA